MSTGELHWHAIARAVAVGAVALLLSGCPATSPVVITPQEQASRVVYTCPNAKTLDVTRIQGQSSAIVVVDGTTLQLSRDTAHKSAERYTNRIQTLTLFGNSATFDAVGRAAYGPCVVQGASGGEGEDGPRRPRSRTRDSD